MDFSATWTGTVEGASPVGGVIATRADFVFLFSLAPGIFGKDVGSTPNHQRLVRPFTMRGIVTGFAADGTVTARTPVFGEGRTEVNFDLHEDGGRWFSLTHLFDQGEVPAP
jgi:hypothetical protein